MTGQSKQATSLYFVRKSVAQTGWEAQAQLSNQYDLYDVELVRIIAGSAVGAALASMGAEVIRVNSSKLKVYTPAQPSSLMAGKTTIDLDLHDPADHAKLIKLIKLFEEADRRGFGLNATLKIANKRGKGIVYVNENCYGPDGTYAERPGWQQVADAAAGSSWVMAQSFGLLAGQGVLPSLSISDMSTSILTALTIALAIRDRIKFGGSYHGHAALAGYNMATLDPEVHLYQPEVVKRIQDKYRFKKWSSDEHVAPLYYEIMRAWKENSKLTDDEKYYVHFRDTVFGSDLRTLAPIVRYDEEDITPKWTSPPVPFCHHEFRTFSSGT